MKQLVCEMCGSTDLMKQDGVFVCQICGCKYSVEEAKKMMIEGTVDVSGSSVKIDNTDMIDNYLSMAFSAADSGNNTEAESYANKVIEMDITNCSAWSVKGSAAGWQTNGRNYRFDEAIDAWNNALNYLPIDDDEKAFSTVEIILNDAFNMGKAIVELHADFFVDYRNDDNCQSLISIMKKVLFDRNRLNLLHNDYLKSLINRQTIIKFEDDDYDQEDIDLAKELFRKYMDIIDEYGVLNMANELAKRLNIKAVAASNASDKDFGPDRSDKSDYAYSNWLSETNNCIDVMNSALSIAENPKLIEQIFENIKSLHENMINSCSYEYIVSGAISGYFRSKSLTDSSKAKHKSDINEARVEKDKRIAEIKKRAEDKKKKRIDKYWEEHADEKIALEQEKEKLLDEIGTLQKQREKATSCIKDEIEPIKASFDAEISELNKLIEGLTTEKDSLGIFKGKEKKIIQEKIDDAEKKKKEIQSKCDSQISEVNNRVKTEAKPYDEKIADLNKRIKEIETEFTKDR